MLFNKVKLQEEQIQGLDELKKTGVLVLVGKYYSRLDYLLFKKRFRDLRLIEDLVDCHNFIGKPENYVKGQILENIKDHKAFYIALLDKKAFSKGYVEQAKGILEIFMELQRDIEIPIFMIPLVVIYRNTLEKENPSFWDIIFGYGDNPGIIRKALIFARYNKNCFLDIGKAVNLRELVGNVPKLDVLADELKDSLIVSINNQKRVSLGPIVKSKEELKQKVLSDQRVLNVIKGLTKDNSKEAIKYRKEAEKYFEEIASDFSPFYAQLFIKFLNWMWNKLFSGIDVKNDQINKVKELARSTPIVYVPSHKSHVDYMVLNYVLYTNFLHSPRIAAGVNLAFWPVGHIFRKTGAFRGARLYTSVFMSYIRMLLEEGYPMEIFIEGGRTRTGKLAIPKAGFLSILIQAYAEGACNNLAFIPVSIDYDKVMEDEGYVKELQGYEKEKESAKKLFRSTSLLKKKYGYIYIRFADPIFLKEFIESKNNIGLEEIGDHLALNIASSINKVSIVTPLSLISSAILSKHRKGFYIGDIQVSLMKYLEFMEHYKVEVSPVLKNPTKAIENTVSLLSQWKVLENIGDKRASFFIVPEWYMMHLEYYKNTMLYHILSHCFVGISVKTRESNFKTEEVLEEFKFLKWLLSNEFIFDEGDEREQVDDCLSYFVEKGYLKEIGPGAFVAVNKEDLELFSVPITGLLEVYWVGVREAIRMLEEDGRVSRILPKNVSQLAKRYQRLRILSNPEGVSQLAINNAVSFLNRVLKERDELAPYLKGKVDPYAFEQRLSTFVGKGPLSYKVDEASEGINAEEQL